MCVALLLLSLACVPSQPSAQVAVPAPATSSPPASAGAATPDPATTDAATATEPPATPASAPDPEAVAAHTRGEQAARQGDPAAALAAFRQAVDIDDDYALAHYDLARILAVLRRQGLVCPFGATEPVILDHLERAVTLDAGLRDRMRQDPDLADLRDTIRYRLLDGADPATDEGLAALVRGVELFGPPQGVYGALARLRLDAGGRAVIGRRQPAADGILGDWAEHDATWWVQDGAVHIDDGGDIQVLRLSVDGTLSDGGAHTWFDSPSECSA